MIKKSEFIATVAPLIVKYGKKYGYPIVSPIIAQAVIESNYGQSKLSADYNNFFGLKCGSSWKGKSVNMKTKEEYKVGSLTTIKDNFRAYDTVEEGIDGYFKFISTKRYANLKKAVTPYEYCVMLKADGYATSSTYVATLYNTITRLNLMIYDNMIEVPSTVIIEDKVSSDTQKVDKSKKSISDLADEVIAGKWGNGDLRRLRLEEAGYDYKKVQKEVNKKLRRK